MTLTPIDAATSKSVLRGFGIALLILLGAGGVASPPVANLTAASVTAGAIAAGGAHSCAVTPAGGVKCWGQNEDGQLGDGTLSLRPSPVDVVGLSGGVLAVATGFSHSCALMGTGGLKCWGRNPQGQLGDGTTSRRTQPVDVSGLQAGAAAVAAGGGHSCALTTEGGVKCWGDNSFGQLGDGGACGGACLTPVDVTGLTGGVAAITAGGYYTCALTAVGGVKCWGNNGFGQLGDGTTMQRTTPVDVAGLTSGVSAITAGADGHTCAVIQAGAIKCWGNNEYGQLGEERGCPTPCVTPVDVQGLTGAVAVTGGYLFTCALTTGQAIKCWGDNLLGQVGDGGSCGILCGSPVDVIGLSSGGDAVTGGWDHACARTTAGTVRCWGDNSYGQIGDDMVCGGVCPSPVDVHGLSRATLGDVNCDGNVSSIDATLILQLAAGLVSSLSCGDSADVSHDGSVNAIDATIILQYVAGLVGSLPP